MERADLLELIESHLSKVKWNGLDSRQLLKVCKVLEEVLEEEDGEDTPMGRPDPKNRKAKPRE